MVNLPKFTMFSFSFPARYIYIIKLFLKFFFWAGNLALQLKLFGAKWRWEIKKKILFDLYFFSIFGPIRRSPKIFFKDFFLFQLSLVFIYCLKSGYLTGIRHFSLGKLRFLNIIVAFNYFFDEWVIPSYSSFFETVFNDH